jgi:hypothetical protein
VPLPRREDTPLSVTLDAALFKTTKPDRNGIRFQRAEADRQSTARPSEGPCPLRAWPGRRSRYLTGTHGALAMALTCELLGTGSMTNQFPS